MHMHVQKERKLVELWLTRTEKNDTAFQESLKPIYLIAVFLSGESDLYQQTRDLLLYNRRRLAEQEVQARKEFSSPMVT